MNRGNLSADWELSSLLDELWLRTRRVLIHQLADANLWMPKREFQQFLVRERELGRSLTVPVLADALGNMDLSCLQSERFMRGGNARFRPKIPLMLAFGYELGSALTGLVSCEEAHAQRAGALSSLFNFGISLFDSILDLLPESKAFLGQHFDQETLSALGSRLKNAQKLRARAEQLQDDELRILLKVIAAFFTRFHELSCDPRGRSTKRDCLLRLQAAYTAELASVGSDAADVDHATGISHAKSTMPFDVIGQLCSLSAGPLPERLDRMTSNLAMHVGEIFWRLDDLADVASDLSARSANSLLLSVGLTPNLAPTAGVVYDGAHALLVGTHVEQFCAAVIARAKSIEDLLEGSGSDNRAVSRFRSLILAYMRSWVT